MVSQRTPLGKGAVSDEQRAMWEAEIRLGREPYVAPAKSRGKFAAFSTFSTAPHAAEAIVGSARPQS